MFFQVVGRGRVRCFVSVEETLCSDSSRRAAGSLWGTGFILGFMLGCFFVFFKCSSVCLLLLLLLR